MAIIVRKSVYDGISKRVDKDLADLLPGAYSIRDKLVKGATGGFIAPKRSDKVLAINKAKAKKKK